MDWSYLGLSLGPHPEMQACVEAWWAQLDTPLVTIARSSAGKWLLPHRDPGGDTAGSHTSPILRMVTMAGSYRLPEAKNFCSSVPRPWTNRGEPAQPDWQPLCIQVPTHRTTISTWITKSERTEEFQAVLLKFKKSTVISRSKDEKNSQWLTFTECLLFYKALHVISHWGS